MRSWMSCGIWEQKPCPVRKPAVAVCSWLGPMSLVVFAQGLRTEWDGLRSLGAEALPGAEAAVAVGCWLGPMSVVVGVGEQKPYSVQRLHTGRSKRADE